MSRSSGRRAQVEPPVALAATLAVVVALTLYAAAVSDAMPSGGDRRLAEPALDRVHDAATPEGTVVDPTTLPRAIDSGPDGFRTNVTLRTRDRRWTAGPPAPRDAATATRTASVGVRPGVVQPATLRVEVWP